MIPRTSYVHILIKNRICMYVHPMIRSDIRDV